MAWEDPVVSEVRQIREQLLEQAGGFEEYIKKLRKNQQEHSERLITKDKLIETDKPTSFS